MNKPASSGGPIVALALTPPYIPSQTYPIIHPVAQVGLSRLNYYADSKGLLVLFGPYLGQVPDETGRIYLNGLLVPTPVQKTVDTTSPLRFLVPLWLLSDGVNNLKVVLQRQSGNEDSSELSVLHSLVAPAANDTDPNPGNSLLSIDVTPKSIGPAEAAAGVIVTMDYPGKQLYDLLTINYGGKTLTHRLVPTAQDPNPETKPVVLTFNTADFAHAPNKPQFIFKYNVISQIDDFSGTSSNGVFNPQEFWSKDCVVNVRLDPITSEDFESYPVGMEFPVGQTIELPSMFVSVLPGADAPSRILSPSSVGDGITEGKALYVTQNESGTTRLDFKSTYSSIRFGSATVPFNGAQYFYRTYDSRQNLLEEQSLTGGRFVLVFSKPGIVRLELEHVSVKHIGTNLVIDNMVMTP
jgi:hypothetical protein